MKSCIVNYTYQNHTWPWSQEQHITKRDIPLPVTFQTPSLTLEIWLLSINLPSWSVSLFSMLPTQVVAIGPRNASCTWNLSLCLLFTVVAWEIVRMIWKCWHYDDTNQREDQRKWLQLVHIKQAALKIFLYDCLPQWLQGKLSGWYENADTP